MANTLITQQVGPVAAQALGLLHTQVILPNLLRRDVAVSGNIAVGDTVNIRKHATLTVNKFDRATGIVTQDVVESSIPVKISDIYDVSVALTAEQLTTDLTSFGDQVTLPATIAIAEAMEKQCVALLKGAPGTVQDIIKATPVQSIIDAMAVLNQNMVPMGGRVIVAGTTTAALLKQSENLLRVDASGSTGALRDATIGRIAGATVYENPYVAADEAYLFTENDAAVFLSRALSSMGTSFSSSQTFEGLAIRTVIDYDITKKNTIASFDTFVGSAILEPKRIVKMKVKP